MPGTFRDDADERSFGERLEANPPAAVIWPVRAFDDMEERSLARIAPRTSAWAQANYRILPGQLGRAPRRLPGGAIAERRPWRWIVMVPGETGD